MSTPHPFNAQDVLAAIAVMAAITLALRALPFVAAKWLQRHAWVAHLGRFLPLAIMVLLLLHTLAGMARTHALGPWPEAVSAALVLVVQWRGRNALWSMLLGTACYVCLRNLGAWA